MIRQETARAVIFRLPQTKQRALKALVAERGLSIQAVLSAACDILIDARSDTAKDLRACEDLILSRARGYNE